MWDPWEEAERLDVEILFIPGLSVGGCYYPARRIVFIDSTRPAVRQRCALAEELGHHVLGHRPNPDPTETARLEYRARKWAAQALLPVELLAAELDGDPMAEAAERLNVTEGILRRRLETLPEDERDELERRSGAPALRRLEEL